MQAEYELNGKERCHSYQTYPQIVEIGLWERINNPHFKLVEFDQFRNLTRTNSFVLSPQKWNIINKRNKHEKIEMKQQNMFKETEIGRISESQEVRRVGADRGGHWEIIK
ncbi:MAG: hypothetical protein C3F06_02805 [Candidatus Methanoperedenaceae archaeon]|nr:MAG: hypothetical protein C3F06_02805 [Candidatus Methanoperedenaceae archaeon]